MVDTIVSSLIILVEAFIMTVLLIDILVYFAKNFVRY